MLTPATETELAEAIAAAQGPLRFEGGGTRPIGHPVEGDTLSLANLSGITLYEPGGLTLVAKAGTPIAEIETALAVENQMLAFEPMDHRALLGTEGVPTIGGVVAGNVSGPRRVQAGACRDFLLGVRFVDGAGQVLKNGGRVMKNVTGYDLVKLMAGSRGTLGVLSEVSFKVLPKPDAVASLLLHGLNISDAVQAMSAALTSPFDVSGAAHVPVGLEGAPVTMIRLEGFEESVGYRADHLQGLLAKFGAIDIERRVEGPQSVTSGWAWMRDVQAFAASDEDVWRISIRPGDAAALIERLGDARVLLDWGGGLVWVACAAGRDVRTDLQGGHATLIRASAETKSRLPVFQPEAAPLAKIASDLRQKFDPKGILNPGLMG
jgi:glycolate oxidase FAD binding subunit